MKIDINNKEEELSFYKEIWLKNINRLMYDNSWSIRELSDKSNLPYDSVKKLLAGKITNPSFYTLLKVSNAFDCSIDFLIDKTSTYGISFPDFSPRVITLLKEVADFELYLKNQNNHNNKENITVIVPTGRCQDGMFFDSFYTESVDISAYRKEFGDIIMCGIKVIGKSLQPTYLCNDILLIAKDRFPLNNEIGIFLYKNKLYIRKYINDIPIVLETINGDGAPIKIFDIDDIHFIGRILTVIRK